MLGNDLYSKCESFLPDSNGDASRRRTCWHKPSSGWSPCIGVTRFRKTNAVGPNYINISSKSLPLFSQIKNTVCARDFGKLWWFGFRRNE